MLEDLTGWLSGDAPGWLGVVVAVATLGGGGFVGGRVAAIARTRHEDRLALLADAYELVLRPNDGWTVVRRIAFLRRALRLPHVERVVAARVYQTDDLFTLWMEIDFLERLVNPGIYRTIHARWSRLVIQCTSPPWSRRLVSKHLWDLLSEESDRVSNVWPHDL